MIAVLFAVARVAARRLQVAIRIRANPNVGPGRRNHERFDSSQNPGIADYLAIGIKVTEAILTVALSA
jgi:hypothetical protein